MADPPPPHALVPLAAPPPPSGALVITERSEGDSRLLHLRPRRALPAFGWLGLAGVVGAIAMGVTDPILAILAIRFGPFAAALGLIGLQLRYSRLQISIDPERLVVAHRPFPTRRAIVEKTLNVEGFHASERYAGSAGGSDGRCWVLELRTRDGRTLELPLRLPARELADSAAERLNRMVREAQTPLTYRG